MKKNIIAFLIFLLLNFNSFSKDIKLNEKELKKVTNFIFKNECNGKNENLIQWNDGEDFLSLGIGHFIWYHKEYKEVYKESFPDLIKFFRKNKVKYPKWLSEYDYNCPWKTKEDFLRAKKNYKYISLQKLLVETKDYQTQFIIKRLEKFVGNFKNYESYKKIKENFYNVANAKNGIICLIDYVNFKGEGISLKERYKGKGWGLVQVLENMDTKSKDPINEFVNSAKKILERRVKNAPKDRNEKRWIPGWFNRLDKYKKL